MQCTAAGWHTSRHSRAIDEAVPDCAWYRPWVIRGESPSVRIQDSRLVNGTGPAPDLSSGGRASKFGENLDMPKRTTAMSAAKGRPKTKSSHASRKPRKKQELDLDYIEIMPAPHVQAYFDELLASEDDELAQQRAAFNASPWLDMLCKLGDGLLMDVGLNARQRKFLWPMLGPLDLDQSVRHINQQYPDFPEESIKEFLIYWIQNDYQPKGYSDAQMDQLERLTARWANDVYPGQTRHS